MNEWPHAGYAGAGSLQKIHVRGSRCLVDLVSVHKEGSDHLLWLFPVLCSSDQTPPEIHGVVNGKSL